MFGISPLGWVHTLGSLPAIPLALYMFARHGRIVPRSGPGKAYFAFMFFGAITIFPIAKMPPSYVIASATLALLLVGYGASRRKIRSRPVIYTETITLTLTGFLLLVPSVSETLRRVPNGHPIAADMNSPILHAALGSMVVLLVIGLTAQIIYIRRHAAPGGGAPQQA